MIGKRCYHTRIGRGRYGVSPAALPLELSIRGVLSAAPPLELSIRGVHGEHPRQCTLTPYTLELPRIMVYGPWLVIH